MLCLGWWIEAVGIRGLDRVWLYVAASGGRVPWDAEKVFWFWKDCGVAPMA